MKAIEIYLKSIKKLCKNHHVDELFAFDASELDEARACPHGFMVRFYPLPPEEYGDNYYSLKDALSEMMGCEVELIEEQALKNPFLEKIINASKISIYGRQDKGMVV